MTNPKDSSEKSPQGSRPRTVSGEAPPTPPPAQQEPENPNPWPSATGQQSGTPGSHTSARRSLPMTQMTVNVGDAGGSSSGAAGSGNARPLLTDAGESPSKKRIRGGYEVGSGSSSGSKVVTDDQAQRGPFACSVCTRSFQTAKALHGHMRAHSERGWRGTYPPPTFSPSDLDRDFKRTMDIVGGRGGGDDAEEEEEEVAPPVLLEEEAAEEERENTPPPQVAAGINVLGDQEVVQDKVEWNLNELPRESTQAEEGSTSSQAAPVPPNKMRPDGKVLDLNDLPPPDSDED